MICSVCNQKEAVVNISWPASIHQSHNVCDEDGLKIFNQLKDNFSGTESYLGFQIIPLKGEKNDQ